MFTAQQSGTGPKRIPLSIPIDLPNDPTAIDGARQFETPKAWSKPIHFIWGCNDGVFTAKWGCAWADMHPQATFDLLPDAGHFPQESHGAQIARLGLGHCDGPAA